MPDTRRKVRIVTGKESGLDNVRPEEPVVLVDGQLLYGVTRIKLDHSYDKGRAEVEITLIGVDVNFKASPKYLVKVVGPPPKEDH